MNLQEIEAFVALAETGSISRAALRLNLTQPATTRRVQNFEAALGGLALLDRRVKPAALTPAGREALERCRDVLRALAALHAGPVGTEPAGELRLGIAHGLGEIVLAASLEELRRRFPKIRLSINSTWTSRLVDEVRGGALDCAVGFVSDPPALPRGLQADVLGTDEGVIVAARDFPIGRSRRLADLAPCGWVVHPPGCGVRAALQRAVDRAGVPLRIAAEVLEEDLQMSLIARRAGLGLVPRRLLEASPRRHRIRRVTPADFRLDLRLALVRGLSLGSLAAPVAWLRDRLVAKVK